ncbi:hydrogenase 2 accessory protein (plasmid) [Rhodovastum atsumiense]|uniref:HypC/HybG/HupF family hydrogenase formation chaperone n=1 Tax=Rhodovastum atsumiense TaxID=504468 RepID=UPI002024AB35|nr:HypC/HybG/HupF family hydrogenase formation chaperone [Rhodovastum atsumiense]CAH2605578.1 hydrogenase 2 accessory protein [Rhodovastum atsumiense]
MCLGVPAQIVAITDSDRMLALAEVAGVRREVNVLCVAEPEEDLAALLGVWVLVHVGFAVSRLDEAEAQATLELLAATGLAEEGFSAGAAPAP